MRGNSHAPFCREAEAGDSLRPPIGNATATETVPNIFRFTGAVWDSQTGLYKMGERFYDPTIGCFAQADPSSGQGYSYTDGNPVNFVDPSGLKPLPGKVSKKKGPPKKHGKPHKKPSSCNFFCGVGGALHSTANTAVSAAKAVGEAVVRCGQTGSQAVLADFYILAVGGAAIGAAAGTVIAVSKRDPSAVYLLTVGGAKSAR